MDEYYGDEEEYWEAVEESETGSGCLSIFLILPFIVILLGIIFSSLLWGSVSPARTDDEPADRYMERNARHPDLAPLFTPEIHFWGDQIVNWANQTGLDPNLVATIMQIESCGDPRARSSVGAAGLFQVMPYHFEWGENPYAPNTNALRGLDYLKQSMDAANGDYRLAFAGYNGGIGVIPKAEAAWAEETIRYVYWGSGIYADALQGASSSARLDEWLEHGGASLCAQARQRQ